MGSRWYITSAFTTFFVFLMLSGTTGETAAKFNERVGETVLVVVLAFTSRGRSRPCSRVADVRDRRGDAAPE